MARRFDAQIHCMLIDWYCENTTTATVAQSKPKHRIFDHTQEPPHPRVSTKSTVTFLLPPRLLSCTTIRRVIALLFRQGAPECRQFQCETWARCRSHGWEAFLKASFCVWCSFHSGSFSKVSHAHHFAQFLLGDVFVVTNLLRVAVHVHIRLDEENVINLMLAEWRALAVCHHVRLCGYKHHEFKPPQGTLHDPETIQLRIP